jgi:hypothetical protein
MAPERTSGAFPYRRNTVKKLLAATALAASLIATNAKAQDTSLSFGGFNPCYDTALEANPLVWQSWTMGYWSGLNSMDAGNGQLGKNMDGSVIWSLIVDECRNNPSEAIQTAVNHVSHRLLGK